MRLRRGLGLINVLIIVLALLFGALPSVAAPPGSLPGYCRRHPERPACTTTTSTTTTSTTTTTTTTLLPTTTTTVPPTTTTKPSSCIGVQVLVGTSIQAAVNANSVGTTFCIAAGTHVRQTVNPKADQTFNCAVGAILDGENTTAFAFRSPNITPAPNNVTIRGCEIKNYLAYESPGWNEGAITSVWYRDQSGGENWLVENVDVHHNRGAGVMLSNLGIIRGSHIHHNYSIGLKLYWAPDGGLVEGNEIDNNNFDAPPDFNETGGSKFAWTSNLIVQQNFVHHNRGPGLWTDIDNVNTLYRDNRTEDNDGPGITHEVSFSATIINNSVLRNGHGAQGSPGDSWMWGAGILVANSGPVHIEANEVVGNDSGVGFIHQNRVEDYGNGPFAYQTSGSAFRNMVTGPGWNGAVQDIGNTNYFVGIVTFEENTYINSTWVFGGNVLTFAEWQSFGHDN